MDYTSQGKRVELISFRCSKETLDHLDDLAERYGRTRADIIDVAINKSWEVETYRTKAVEYAKSLLKRAREERKWFRDAVKNIKRRPTAQKKASG